VTRSRDRDEAPRGHDREGHATTTSHGHDARHPGKRTLTDGLAPRATTSEDVEDALKDAEIQLTLVPGHAERLRTAVSARDFETARDAGNALEVALLLAGGKLRDAKARLGRIGGSGNPSLSPQNWLGDGKDEEGASTRIADVEARLAAEQAKAQPLLALRPGNHRREADEWAGGLLQDPEALARLDAADETARREWLAKLDGAGRGGGHSRRLDLRSGRKHTAAATIDAPPEFDESRATIADDRHAETPADGHGHVTTTPHVANASGAPVTIDAPPQYEETRATIQLSAEGEPDVAPSAIHGVAAAGVADATERLPHLDTIQQSFGRHDVGHVRAQVGGVAEGASRSIGAEAYAVGDRVGFAATPTLHTAAHEAAHVVQQRAGVSLKGGVGAVGDAYEQHADRVADAVVSGASAESLLDAYVGGTHGAAQAAIQRESGPAFVDAGAYLHSNRAGLRSEIVKHLTSVEWPQPDVRLPWRAQQVFRGELARFLVDFLGELNATTNLDQLCHPHKPLALVDDLRPTVPAPGDGADTAKSRMVGPSDWRPSIGVAIAQQLEAAIHGSLRRLGPRWVAAADQHVDAEAMLDETRSHVRYESLVTSMPIDRIVGRAITGPAVFDFREDPKRAAAQEGPGAKAAGPRKVVLEWQGTRDPRLWNWVRAVDPADATVEEVAATLFRGSEAKYGEQTTFLAYRLTAAPPLFGMAPSQARVFAEGRAHEPKEGGATDPGPADRVLTVAKGAVASDIALQQGSDEALPSVGKQGPVSTIIDLVAGNRLQLAYLVRTLAPRGLAETVGGALGFLEAKQVELLRPDADLEPWARILTAQRENLQRVGAGVRQVVEKADKVRLGDPQAPESSPLREILAAYARAAACSHLVDTSRDLIDQAAAQQATLTLRAVQSSTHAMDFALDGMREQTATGDDDRKTLLAEGDELQARSRALQSRLIAGEDVGAVELDDFAIDSGTAALRGRVRGAQAQLDVLKAAAHSAGEGLFAALASAFSGEFGILEQATGSLHLELALVLEALKLEGATGVVPGVEDRPEERRAKEQANRRAALDRAEAEFRKLAENDRIGRFLRHGAELVAWQEFRTACVKMAAMIGVSFVASAAGAGAAGFVGRMFRASGGAASVAELSTMGRVVAGGANLVVDAGVNTIGQHAVMDTKWGEALTENLVLSAGAMTVLGVLQREAEAVSAYERSVGVHRTTTRLGAVGRELGALYGHTIMGMALGYVSGKLATGQDRPPPETIEEWFLQGAAIAVGRYVHKAVAPRHAEIARIKALKEYDNGALLRRAAQVERLAAKVEDNPRAEAALDLLVQRREMLEAELTALDRLLADEPAMRAANVDAREVRGMMGEVRQQLREAHDDGASDITMHLAGLEELVPGAVWRGSFEQIDLTVRRLKGQGMQVEANRDLKTGTWTLDIEGRVIQAHERGAIPGERLTLMGDDHAARAATEKLPLMEGTLDVVVHGSIDDIYVRRGGDEVRMDHRALATFIRKSGAKFKRVRLVSCQTGWSRGDVAGIAQHLANKLGVEVLAPDDVLHIRENDGSHTIGAKATRDTGEWQAFSPRKARTRYEKASPREADAEQAPREDASGKHEEEAAHDDDVASGRDAAATVALGKEHDPAGGASKPPVDELTRDSEAQFEAGVNVGDPLFGRAASDALVQANRAQVRDGNLAAVAELRTLKNRVRSVQNRVLDALRDPSLDVDARRRRLNALIEEMEQDVLGHRELFPDGGQAFDFAAARAAVARDIDASFDKKMIMDSRGTIRRGGVELGTFRDLVDQVLAANRAWLAEGVARELVIVDSSAGGVREILVLSRERKPGAPREGGSPLIIQAHPDPSAVIIDVGAGDRASRSTCCSLPIAPAARWCRPSTARARSMARERAAISRGRTRFPGRTRTASSSLEIRSRPWTSCSEPAASSVSSSTTSTRTTRRGNTSSSLTS
jgi:hypothetical protein